MYLAKSSLVKLFVIEPSRLEATKFPVTWSTVRPGIIKSLPSLLKVKVLSSAYLNSISTRPSVVVRILKFWLLFSQNDENST